MAKTHWGNWIWRRAELRGFGSQGELAKAIGLTRAATSRMLARSLPTRMEAKTVDGLVDALNLSESTIRRDWWKFSPENTPEQRESFVDMYVRTAEEQRQYREKKIGEIVSQNATESEQIRRQIVDLVGHLEGPYLVMVQKVVLEQTRAWSEWKSKVLERPQVGDDSPWEKE